MDALEKSKLASFHYGYEIWFINASGILTKNNNNCTKCTIGNTSIVFANVFRFISTWHTIIFCKNHLKFWCSEKIFLAINVYNLKWRATLSMFAVGNTHHILNIKTQIVFSAPCLQHWKLLGPPPPHPAPGAVMGGGCRLGQQIEPLARGVLGGDGALSIFEAF